MPLKTDAVGKTYPPLIYAVGREKVREYSLAVGETNPLYLDAEAARAAGYRDVVAPPMFAVVYSAGSVGPPIFDPEVGIDFMRMVHGSQEFVWGEPVQSGDTVTTTTTFKEYREKDGRKFYVFESVSKNHDDMEVVRGTWTNIVR